LPESQEGGDVGDAEADGQLGEINHLQRRQPHHHEGRHRLLAVDIYRPLIRQLHGADVQAAHKSDGGGGGRVGGHRPRRQRLLLPAAAVHAV
jgi:hypothetical protein